MGKFVDLATKILEQCHALEASLSSEDLEQWSEFPELQLGMPTIMAKAGAQAALAELAINIKTPTETVTSEGMRTVMPTAFQAMYRFRIADAVPTDHDASYANVAEACGLPEQDLKRIVRYLITWNIFAEPQPGRIAHNGASRAFRENKLLQQTIGMCTEELVPSGVFHVDAMVKWPGSGEANQCGSNLAKSTELDFFQGIAASPTRAKRFADAMTFMGNMPGLSTQPLVDTYDWNSLGEATVVDVGGSHGGLAKRLLEKYPKLSFIVQDLSSTVDGAQQQSRISFMEHNFFHKQPVQADAYVFRWIFHDWPDKDCIRILQSLIPALKQGARVLIMDFVVSEPGRAPRQVQQAERAFDITMWCMNNAKERSKEEWHALVKQADARFKLEKIIPAPGCLLCVLDIRWDDQAETQT